MATDFSDRGRRICNQNARVQVGRVRPYQRRDYWPSRLQKGFDVGSSCCSVDLAVLNKVTMVIARLQANVDFFEQNNR
jgi:hypothetical protein